MKKGSTEKPEVSAKQKALDILLYRTRTEKELYNKLIEKGYSEEDSAEALDYVRHFGYVDDEDYARRYVASHSRDEGRFSLKRHLSEKGVPDEFIEAALDDLPDEEETLSALLIRKYGSPHPLDEREYRRIYGFLVRHGFSNASIRTALQTYQDQAEN